MTWLFSPFIKGQQSELDIDLPPWPLEGDICAIIEHILPAHMKQEQRQTMSASMALIMDGLQEGINAEPTAIAADRLQERMCHKQRSQLGLGGKSTLVFI